MKRVRRNSRRGGSRPGMMVTTPGQGGGSGTADRDLSVRCHCRKTGQTLTCVNMDCPECLDTMCSQVPYRNRDFRKVSRRSFSGGGATPRGGFFSLPSGERNFGQQASLPYDQQLNMNHKSNFSHCGTHSNMNHKSNFVHSNMHGYSNMAHSNMNHKSNFAHKNFAHNNFAHSNFISGGNTDAIFSGGTSNVGPTDRIFAGNYASGRRGTIKPLGERGTVAGACPPPSVMGRDGRCISLNPTNPADRDAICIYKCNDTEFCSIKAPNCDFVDFGPCCREDGGAMYGTMGQF